METLVGGSVVVSVGLWEVAAAAEDRHRLLYVQARVVLSGARARFLEASCGADAPWVSGLVEDSVCCLPQGHAGGHDGDLYGRDWSLETVEYQRVVRAFLDAKTREADYYDLWMETVEELNGLRCGALVEHRFLCDQRRGHAGDHGPCFVGVKGGSHG